MANCQINSYAYGPKELLRKDLRDLKDTIFSHRARVLRVNEMNETAPTRSLKGPSHSVRGIDARASGPM
jgi:hypothetical protein